MPFTTPLALLGLLFVPAVVAMYLLKLRREERPVPSTLLWHRLVADVEANAPWQRLRRSLLFLLQLLLVIVLVLLAARPFLERPAGLARDIVLVVDTSASMGATDLQPDRLAAAKAAAIDMQQERLLLQCNCILIRARLKSVVGRFLQDRGIPVATHVRGVACLGHSTMT